MSFISRCYRQSSLLLAVMLPINCLAAEVTPGVSIKAKGDVSVVKVKAQSDGLRPWWQGGTGQLAEDQSGLQFGPQLLAMGLDVTDHLSATLHAQWHNKPSSEFGITEAWLSYQPLPLSGYRFSTRAGWFYPAMSLENTDTAWSSPYSRNFSAINSWLGEELRARGIEVNLSRPGRFFQSQHSYQWVAGVFQGNDPLGSILSWRGFAMHPYQSNIGEKVRFANYPSIRSGVLVAQPDWVQPTRELDHRVGYYAGVHWLYRQDTELRLYHYDNNGDPLVLRHGQYAWDTRMQSVALQHQLNDQLRLVAQHLNGSTEMGPKAVVVDYQSWFVLFNLQLDSMQWTVRYDHFVQQDKDQLQGDDNNGKGHGWTLAWQYPLSPAFAVALEWNQLHSSQANRAQWQDWPVDRNFQQLQLLLNWRYD